jgi:hypothetical protein
MRALLRGAGLLAAWLTAAAVTAATPDFSGTWERYPPPGETADPRYAPSPIPNPPLKPDHLKQWQAHEALLAERLQEGQPPGDNYVQCLPDGMPAMMQGMFPMEIIQQPRQVTIIQEAFNQTRRVYMDEKLPPADELDPSFYGRSVGRWEGDTLVIETTGIKPSVMFRWAPHSEKMKIVERLRLVASDILQDEIVVHDDYLEKPWSWTYSFRRLPGYKMQEYVCEDNRDYMDSEGKVRLRIKAD